MQGPLGQQIVVCGVAPIWQYEPALQTPVFAIEQVWGGGVTGNEQGFANTARIDEQLCDRNHRTFKIATHTHTDSHDIASISWE